MKTTTRVNQAAVSERIFRAIIFTPEKYLPLCKKERQQRQNVPQYQPSKTMDATGRLFRFQLVDCIVNEIYHGSASFLGYR
ncbi:MAG: hypothetical protein LBT43_04115 [Prevotella sp.]|nr:hypothetical protein [Prevotella sp.]